jgi:outer membrane protein assembly factor BamB
VNGRPARFLCAVAAALAAGAPAAPRHWPSFRGPAASGVGDGLNPPIAWNAADGTNVAWKTAIPGLGHSSPIVWGDRVFVTTAVASAGPAELVHGLVDTMASAADDSPQAWKVYALDLATGRVLWERMAREAAPKVRRHVKGSHANPTPATDGRFLVASFGSEGLYCYDLDGSLIWTRDLGVLDGGWTSDPRAHWGFGSSPVIHRDRAIVQADTQSSSFLAAYRLDDGREVWKVERGESSAWGTSTVVEREGRSELVTTGTTRYRAYDPATGEELWRLTDEAEVKIPTPVASGGVIYLGGGASGRRAGFWAVRAGGRGDITPAGDGPIGPHVAWRNAANPHVVTPLVYRGRLFVCTDAGVLTVYDAATGARLDRLRVGGRAGAFTASPVAADGRLYFASEDGEVFVLDADNPKDVLAVNSIGEVVMATPAIARGMLVVRGRHHLFGIRARRTAA